MQNILINGMDEFLRIHVLCFPQYKSVKTNFIGSVGFHFQDELKIAAKKVGVNIGEINKKPIDGLVDYHLNYSLT